MRAPIPSRRPQRLTAALLLLAAVAIVGPPAAADWLVLQDGQVLETKGPWKVEGRRVIYTASNGTFSAIRASHVDLEESRRVTDAGGVREEPDDGAEPGPERSAVLVVRQGDVRTLSSRVGSQQASSPGAQSTPEGTIGVVQWDEEVVEQGTKLTGTLRNGTESVYLPLRLEVTLVAENGDPLANRRAELLKNWADPGEELSFEVSFPEVYAYSTVSFEIDGQPLQTTNRSDEEEDARESDSGDASADDDEDGDDRSPPR